MVNKKVDHFIRACAHCKLVNPCSHKAQHLLQNIDPDTPFDVIFIDFWEPGDIPDQEEYRKIHTCLDLMKGFGIGAATGLKKITSDQAAQWAFGNFLVPFGIPKIIVVNADGLFDGMSKKNFQDTFLFQVHPVERGNHKEIGNEGFHRYLNKV